MASVVSEPGTRIATRFAVARLPRHHGGDALAVRIEEQHVLGAQAGQCAGERRLPSRWAAFGRCDSPGVGRVAGGQRAGRQRGGCLGHGGRAGWPGRGRGAEHGDRDQRCGGQVAKSHRGVLPACSAFRSGSYGRRWLAGVGPASRLPACPAGTRPVTRAARRGAAGRHGRTTPTGVWGRRYAARGTRFPGRRAYAEGMDVKAVSRFAATFVTDTTNPPAPRPALAAARAIRPGRGRRRDHRADLLRRHQLDADQRERQPPWPPRDRRAGAARVRRQRAARAAHTVPARRVGAFRGGHHLVPAW